MHFIALIAYLMVISTSLACRHQICGRTWLFLFQVSGTTFVASDAAWDPILDCFGRSNSWPLMPMSELAASIRYLRHMLPRRPGRLCGNIISCILLAFPNSIFTRYIWPSLWYCNMPMKSCAPQMHSIFIHWLASCWSPMCMQHAILHIMSGYFTAALSLLWDVVFLWVNESLSALSWASLTDARLAFINQLSAIWGLDPSEGLVAHHFSFWSLPLPVMPAPNQSPHPRVIGVHCGVSLLITLGLIFLGCDSSASASHFRHTFGVGGVKLPM